MAGSDGIFRGGFPHPRGWGAFARYLGYHTRTLGDYTWPEAITHLTTHAARRYRLTDRGLVRPGYVADLAILDRETVTDRSTYAAGRTLAEGVKHVIVNGVLALEDGEPPARPPAAPSVEAKRPISQWAVGLVEQDRRFLHSNVGWCRAQRGPPIMRGGPRCARHHPTPSLSFSWGGVPIPMAHDCSLSPRSVSAKSIEPEPGEWERRGPSVFWFGGPRLTLGTTLRSNKFRGNGASVGFLSYILCLEIPGSDELVDVPRMTGAACGAWPFVPTSMNGPQPGEPGHGTPLGRYQDDHDSTSESRQVLRGSRRPSGQDQPAVSGIESLEPGQRVSRVCGGDPPRLESSRAAPEACGRPCRPSRLAAQARARETIRRQDRPGGSIDEGSAGDVPRTRRPRVDRGGQAGHCPLHRFRFARG